MEREEEEEKTFFSYFYADNPTKEKQKEVGIKSVYEACDINDTHLGYIFHRISSPTFSYFCCHCRIVYLFIQHIFVFLNIKIYQHFHCAYICAHRLCNTSPHISDFECLFGDSWGSIYWEVMIGWDYFETFIQKISPKIYKINSFTYMDIIRVA